MSTERIPPTPAQQRLVNIGMLIQFHLAAIGHLVVWLWMVYELFQPVQPHDEGRIVVEVAAYAGIPISFGFLIAVYLFFRYLLAYAKFDSALKTMIIFNAFHAVICCMTIIAPIRLIVPIILYRLALRSIGKNEPQPENVTESHKEPTDVS